MADKIKIIAGDVEMTATLVESKTAKALVEVLPVESKGARWGDEIYFKIPLKTEGENLVAKVPSGAVAYWPPGNAFCIFFGQTPYSPVNVVGQLDGDPNEFAAVNEGDTVKLRKSE